MHGCAATVPSDLQLVHTLIHEQHGGVEAFDQLVRSKVRVSVEWLMWREELLVGVWVFGFWFIVYWFWYFCIHASLGTFHPKLGANLFIVWGDDHQALAIAVHVVVVVVGVVVGCCVTPLALVRKVKKRTGEHVHGQHNPSRIAVAPAPSVPQLQPQAVPQQAVAAQPADAPQPQGPVAVPIAQPMATTAFIDVACPVGAGPGVTVVQHQGKAFSVTVPAGVQPDQHFQVQVPALEARTLAGNHDSDLGIAMGIYA